MKHTVFEQGPGVDIHKIIDDAMQKRDRSVMVYIGEHGTSISVTPLDADKPRWIPVTYSDNDRVRGYKCSVCGYEDEYDHHPYCAMCGEKLARPN